MTWQWYRLVPSKFCKHHLFLPLWKERHSRAPNACQAPRSNTSKKEECQGHSEAGSINSDDLWHTWNMSQTCLVPSCYLYLRSILLSEKTWSAKQTWADFTYTHHCRILLEPFWAENEALFQNVFSSWTWANCSINQITSSLWLRYATFSSQELHGAANAKHCSEQVCSSRSPVKSFQAPRHFKFRFT